MIKCPLNSVSVSVRLHPAGIYFLTLLKSFQMPQTSIITMASAATKVIYKKCDATCNGKIYSTIYFIGTV